MKFTKFIPFVLFVLIGSTLFAQDWQELKDRGSNYFDIQRAFYKANGNKLTEFKKELKREAQNGDKDFKSEKDFESMIHYMRWANFWGPRTVESKGDLSAVSEATMRAIERQQKTLQTRAAANWTTVGPFNTPTNGGNGRVNAVRFHPTQANVVFACTPAGGLWKSTDGGSTWSAITDAIAALGCTDVAFDPANASTMYLLTGDGEAADVLTTGVYKSTDGGTTWSPTGLTFTLGNAKTLSKILIDPTNGAIIVGGRAGIYRSTDGGASWTQTMTGGVRDLEFKPGTPSVVYAGGYGANAGFFRSTDNGVTWSTITTGLPANTGVQRVAVAVTSLDPNYVYLLIANNTDYGLRGVYQSTDGGTTFTTVITTPNILGWNTNGGDAGGQGWYDLSIAVDPSDKNTIYTGGVNIWKGVKTTSWSFSCYGYWSSSPTVPYVHADIHDLTFNGTTLWIGCDGGVFNRATGAASFTNKSGNMSIAQIYGLGLSATNSNTIISGHQDNGTNITYNTTSWSQNLGGDGMLCFIDRTSDTRMFGSIYNGALYRSTNSGSSFTSVYTVPGGAWVTPWLQDPVTATTFYALGSGLYRSSSTTSIGASWAKVGTFTAPTNYQGAALDVAKTNNQVMIAAFTDNTTTGLSKLYTSTNAGTSWTERTTATGFPASVAILGVHIDVNNANTMYVGIASYTGNAVYVSNDGGVTWSNLSTGLPQVPVNCFVTQNGAPGVVYCGTDLGVYFKDNSSSSWSAFTTGMPGVPVRDLEIFYPTNTLRAATYGRGIWQSPISAGSGNTAPSVSITSPTSGSSFVAPATMTINANATDSDGSIANVDFYNGTTLLGSDNTAPYSFTWSNVAAGTYSLTAKAIDNGGATTTSTAVSVTVTSAPVLDAGISAITAPSGTVTTASITPVVTLRNFGTVTLTSATISYKVDNGTVSNFSWTGSLAAGATVNVTLPTVTYSAGSHTFTANTASPNGGTDASATNDASTSSFSYTVSNCNVNAFESNNTAGTAATLAVNSTNNAAIGTSTDVDFYKFSTTASAPKVKVTLTNLPADYDMTLYYVRSNGNLATITTSQNTGATSESITYNTPTTALTYYIKVYGYQSAFSATNCYTLTVTTSATNLLAPDKPTANGKPGTEGGVIGGDFDIFPNPASDVVNMHIAVENAGDYTISLVDLLGKTHYTERASLNAGESFKTLKVADMPKGVYIVTLTNGNDSWAKKFVKE